MKVEYRDRYELGPARGMTLVELLVVIAIAAMLMGIAAPSFQQTFSETRVATRANELVSALAMARSEAIRRNIRVTLCKTADISATPLACDEHASWNQGWILFVDNVHVAGNGVGVIDGPDTPLRVFPIDSGTTLEGGLNYAAGISYLPSGVSRGIKTGGVAGLANGSFALCGGAKGRKIIINTAGRARTEALACD